MDLLWAGWSGVLGSKGGDAEITSLFSSFASVDMDLEQLRRQGARVSREPRQMAPSP
ncbi:hypothetical protein [Streptomyces subrutilus]|uniref:hypothetical protein n=1 Tax=Streptomyces subrutilus TaxID=36818 RepID=UPI002E12BAFB|nr:hypothetical protein OG479_33575 [Streptomyces subrutilus]